MNEGLIDSHGKSPARQFQGLVPIGSIVAWHKAPAGTPGLPENFVECSGQTLIGSGSPYDGQVIPDLNGDSRHLEGSATSGTETAATVAASGAGGDGFPDTFTVVWVMRIK